MGRALGMLLVLLAAIPVSAQTNPIVAARVPSNTTTLPEPVWSTAGATITDRSTVCATVSLSTGSGNAAANTTAINSAISGCASGQVVSLPAGTYYYNGFKVDGHNNVTIRGAGPGSTILIVNNDLSCRGYGSLACIINDINNADYVPDNPINVSNWTAGYSKGTTSITLSARTLGATSPQVGMLLHLDQLDDSNTDPWPALWNCQSTTCSDEGGDAGRTGRGQTETQLITSVSGTGPYTVGISPGVLMPNWSSGKTPQAHWSNDQPISGVGIEDVGIDVSGLSCASPADNRGIVFFNAYNSWLKRVRIYKPCRDHVLLFQSRNVTVRDSYFYEGQFHQSQSYGIETFLGSLNLVENNIFQRIAAPVMFQGGMANVAGYNYQVDDGYDNPTSWMQAGTQHHTSSVNYDLSEGNDLLGVKGDIIHGTTSFNTSYRNRLRGWYTGETSETNAVKIYANSRFWNVLGNVMGTSTYHAAYKAQTNAAIINLGDSAVDGTPAADSHVAESTFIWGNWDTVTGTRWCGASGNTGWTTTCSSTSEVPTGLTNYAQTVPSSETLPNSLYLAAKPSWFGSTPWPAAGPDVTGGDISNVGGHAYKIPARLCYENGSKDASNFLTNFDPSTCYADSDADPVVTITAPTSNTTYSTSTSPLTTLAGTCSDDGTVSGVTWSNDRGGSGSATGTTSWSVGSITLSSGANVITVTCTDDQSATGVDTLTVTYTPAANGFFKPRLRLRIGGIIDALATPFYE